jgi:hypothetical protein
MSGAIAMGTSKITGLGDPTSAQDAATKTYVDTADNLKLNLSGGTMSGNITMGSNAVTSTSNPTTDDELSRKGYVDSILGSATSSETSATAAANSAADAEKLAVNPEDSQYTLSDGTTTGYSALHYAAKADDSATAAAGSATAAAASYDSFDDRYLGAKASAPSTDNDGDALIVGALYFDTTTDTMKVYASGGWVAAGSAVNGTANRYEYVVGTASGSYTGSTTTFPATYDAGFVDVYLNGVKLIPTTDFTATSGTQIVLTSAASTSDEVSIIGYGTFSLANFSINDANDVSTAGVTDGQTLLYNSTSGDFEPGDVDALPDQTSNAGKYLTTDGSTASWGDVDALPSQTGQSGKYLTTDGSTASWDTIDTDSNTTTKSLYEMANTISANYSITSGNNAMSAGPISIDSGISVTIPSGSVWTIV